MFIKTESTSNDGVLAFLPGRTVLETGRVAFADADDAESRSPLARSIFEIDAVARVVLASDRIEVTKFDSADWHDLKPRVLGAIMAHFMSGEPVLVEGGQSDKERAEIIAEVTELIETRVLPAVADAGGDVIFRAFKDGVVYLDLQGAANSLKGPIQNMLRHYVPEVVEVRDFSDAGPKPGLDTPEGRAIQELLDQSINPSVAMHGGHIALIDLKDDKAYIRLEGGCQGCGMASVTLKQGVEVAIKEAVPSITEVLDTTDHAGGSNPYFQPSKGGGASPFE